LPNFLEPVGPSSLATEKSSKYGATEVVLVVTFAFLGAAIGSFLNVCQTITENQEKVNSFVAQILATKIKEVTTSIDIPPNRNIIKLTCCEIALK